MFNNPNRANKRKQKKGDGCKMCKPHKGKWESFFKPKEKALRSEEDFPEDNLPTRINSKVKQFFGGNWGHPRPYVKKKTEIKPLRTSAPKRRKKKTKRDWFWKACPFCGEEIKSKPGKNKYSIFNKIYDTECSCGAKEVEDCPCCHRKTWFKDEIYKHEGNINCGFVGKRRKDNGKHDS